MNLLSSDRGINNNINDKALKLMKMRQGNA